MLEEYPAGCVDNSSLTVKANPDTAFRDEYPDN